jgi:hypothetical protein
VKKEFREGSKLDNRIVQARGKENHPGGQGSIPEHGWQNLKSEKLFREGSKLYPRIFYAKRNKNLKSEKKSLERETS